jgi:GNAT superfamily N-acetyltransferase
MTEAATRSPAEAPGVGDWSIRPAGTDDVPAVAAAVAALLAELGGSSPPRAAIEAEARAHVEDPSLGIVLVAEREAAPAGADPLADVPTGGGADPLAGRSAPGELVGVLTASWARAIQVAGRLLTIEVLWTRRDHRGHGVGAALVDALASEAATEGAGRVEVGLPREGFPALRATERFYLANGFERLGPRMRRSVR